MSGAARKGVVLKLFGIILMALGALDSMLAWRGGLAETDFHFMLFLAGALLYAIGAIRGLSGRCTPRAGPLAQPCREPDRR